MTGAEIDTEVVQLARRLGMRATLTQLREYAHHMAENAFEAGYDGQGWYELHDIIDQAIPAGSDTSLDGVTRYGD